MIARSVERGNLEIAFFFNRDPLMHNIVIIFIIIIIIISLYTPGQYTLLVSTHSWLVHTPG